MAGGHEDAERVQAETVAEWRGRLEASHERPDGVWLVTFKKGSGRPVVTYGEAVEEARCFGWIDSIRSKVDDERTRLWFSLRKPKRAWSAVNKERIERLEREGRMAPAGQRMVELAEQTGTWSALDEVEALVVPDDLATVFAEHQGPPSSGRASPGRPAPASCSGSSRPRSLRRGRRGSRRRPRRRLAASGPTSGRGSGPGQACSWGGEPVVRWPVSLCTIISDDDRGDRRGHRTSRPSGRRGSTAAFS